MKTNLLPVLVLSIISLFAGCGSDDGGDGDDGGSGIDQSALAALIGDWETDEISASGCSDSSENGTTTCVDETLLTFCLSVQITEEGFLGTLDRTDPTFFETGGGQIQSLSSSAITYCETDFSTFEEVCTTINYTLQGSTTLRANWTDVDSPGCTFTATFTKTE